MPCDSMSMSVVNPEYEDVLNEIEVLTCKYDQYQVVLCGDFNTSFERNPAQTKKLDNFIRGNNHGLFVSWDHAESKKEYTCTIRASTIYLLPQKCTLALRGIA